MTAAGLAVAIPAVLAYNVFGKRVAASEAELEGFAHDLREMVERRRRCMRSPLRGRADVSADRAARRRLKGAWPSVASNARPAPSR